MAHRHTGQRCVGRFDRDSASSLPRGCGPLRASSSAAAAARHRYHRAKHDAWKQWYDHDAPETQAFPDYNERLDQFEKMLLVRAIREDRALLAIDNYISATLGREYLIAENLNLTALHDEASAYVPMITLLSTGSDPTGKINDLARKKKKQVRTISMGQGQEPAARKLIATGVTQGSWVMLQNCHLGLKFMAEVEQTLLKLEEVSPDFCLFLT